MTDPDRHIIIHFPFLKAAICRRKCKMNIRPRRTTVWGQKGNTPIFRIADFRQNDFSVTMPDHTEEAKYAKKSKNEGPKNISKKMLQEVEHYCEKTTLHGLRYVGDTSLSLGERFFWFVAFACAVGFAAYFITTIYKKWNLTPVIISFSPFDAKLSSIPFPSITICNMNQARREEALKILRDGPDVEKKLLDDLCNSNNSFNETTENAPKWDVVRNFLVKVGHPCSEMLKSCKWKSQKINCEDIFNNDLTDEGLCCSFNRLPPALIFRNSNEVTILNQTYPDNVYDWSPERGFTDKDTGDDSWIPRRPLGAGTHLGLTIILDAQIDHYYCSSTESVGFKVIMANPIETPKMMDFGSLLGPGKEVRYEIDPTIKEATDALRGIAIAKRQCYFSNERPLYYFRTYTQRNCKLECQSNYTLRECGCIPYFLPKNRMTNVCGKIDETCTDLAKENMELTYGNASSCDCLPGCFEMNFALKATYSPLSRILSFKQDLGNISSQYVVDNMAIAHFYFQETMFRKQIKSELYGFTEVLSNVGGLLGLCLGFSFLSFIELVYFLTLRVFCSVLNKKRKNRNNNNKPTVFPFLK